MVEWTKRKIGMRGYGENHHEKWGLKRIPCASHFTIPDTAGTSPNPACNNADTRWFQSNQGGRTPDFSYPLVITSFSSSSPIPLFLIHNSTIIAEHKVKSSLSISPCHVQELTPSTAYTEYSIHARWFVFPSLSWLLVDPWMQQQLPVCLPTWLTAISQLSMRAQRQSHRVTFPRLRVN